MLALMGCSFLVGASAWAAHRPLPSAIVKSAANRPLPMSNAKSKVRMDANAPMQLVRLQCPIGLSAQDLSEAMLESGALFVSVSDGAEGTDAEEPIFAAHSPGAVETHLESWSELMQARQLWSNASLEVGFTADADVEDTLLGAAAIAGLGALPRFSISSIDQRDWVTEVQNNWPPICLPGCLTIQFPWHTAADVAAAREASGSSGADTIDGTDGEEDGVLLTLQPGMAFGTGEHATTQLCCLALRRLLRAEGSGRGCTILDYGSGSGVLAFAALRFGAARAVGVEIDPEALATSVRLPTSAPHATAAPSRLMPPPRLRASCQRFALASASAAPWPLPAPRLGLCERSLSLGYPRPPSRLPLSPPPHCSPSRLPLTAAQVVNAEMNGLADRFVAQLPEEEAATEQ